MKSDEGCYDSVHNLGRWDRRCLSPSCVCLTNYTCVCVDRQYYNVRMAGFFSSWWVEWDSGCGCVCRGQAARHTCMLVVLSFAVLDVRPPSFSFSLIRTSNFSAVDSSNECGGGDGGLLGLFRAALGEVLHQDPARRDRRLSMPHSNSNQVNSLSYL